MIPRKKKYPVWIFLLLLPLLLWLFSDFANTKTQQEQLYLTQQAVTRAVLQCYALEGSYPPDLSYLEHHYGIFIDKSRFFVDYQYIAANLPPDITVIPIHSETLF